jgi:putative DNA primase/helicase
LTENGVDDATKDPATVERWWRRWPKAMIGVAAGEKSGFFALDLDIDAEKGIDGIAAFEPLRNGRELPTTIAVRSPRGGLHLYFKHLPGLRNDVGGAKKNGGLPRGVDVRASGGYVIGVPSRRVDGAEYSFEHDDPDGPAAAPEWLVNLILPKAAERQDEPASQGTASNGDHARAEAYARAALERECAEVVGARSGTRNHTLNRAAFALGQLIGGGLLSEGEVRSRLTSAAEACGLVRDDGKVSVKNTIDSGIGAGTGKPREAPRADAKGKSNGVGREEKVQADRGAPPQRQPASQPVAAPRFSDEALALAFAEQHSDALRYVAQWSQWMSWTTTHWQADTTLHAFDLARQVAREFAATCTKKGTATQLTSAKTVAAVERLAKADRRLAATDAQWDGLPADLNTPAKGP